MQPKSKSKTSDLIDFNKTFGTNQQAFADISPVVDIPSTISVQRLEVEEYSPNFEPRGLASPENQKQEQVSADTDRASVIDRIATNEQISLFAKERKE